MKINDHARRAGPAWCERLRKTRMIVVRQFAAAFVLAAFALISLPAHADVAVYIDKSSQSMTVRVNGFPLYYWQISSARRGYRTPNGTFRPQRLARHWYSRKYHNSPMPHSVFFYKGFAIHGTNYVSQLGRPA